MGTKGVWQRPCDQSAFDAGYERTFGRAAEPTPIPTTVEEWMAYLEQHPYAALPSGVDPDLAAEVREMRWRLWEEGES